MTVRVKEKPKPGIASLGKSQLLVSNLPPLNCLRAGKQVLDESTCPTENAWLTKKYEMMVTPMFTGCCTHVFSKCCIVVDWFAIGMDCILVCVCLYARHLQSQRLIQVLYRLAKVVGIDMCYTDCCCLMCFLQCWVSYPRRCYWMRLKIPSRSTPPKRYEKQATQV